LENSVKASEYYSYRSRTTLLRAPLKFPVIFKFYQKNFFLLKIEFVFYSTTDARVREQLERKISKLIFATRQSALRRGHSKGKRGMEGFRRNSAAGWELAASREE